jgi:hypothetical protein
LRASLLIRRQRHNGRQAEEQFPSVHRQTSPPQTLIAIRKSAPVLRHHSRSAAPLPTLASSQRFRPSNGKQGHRRLKVLGRIDEMPQPNDGGAALRGDGLEFRRDLPLLLPNDAPAGAGHARRNVLCSRRITTIDRRSARPLGDRGFISPSRVWKPRFNAAWNWPCASALRAATPSGSILIALVVGLVPSCLLVTWNTAEEIRMRQEPYASV